MAQNIVDAGLVTPTIRLRLEPVNQICIQPDGDGGLVGTEMTPSHRTGPLLIGQFRDVACVDIFISNCGEVLKLLLEFIIRRLPARIFGARCLSPFGR